MCAGPHTKVVPGNCGFKDYEEWVSSGSLRHELQPLPLRGFEIILRRVEAELEHEARGIRLARLKKAIDSLDGRGGRMIVSLRILVANRR
jgi:hypothetical protein